MLFFPVFCFAQYQYRFDHFSIKNGLSQNSVHCILKDSEGYYWFGTQDGLNRYDGYSVKIYKHDREDSTSISDNFILCIIEDKHTNLWIGTRNGLNHFNRKKEKFTKIIVHEKEKVYFHNAIWTVFLDKSGNILFSNSYNEIVRINSGDIYTPSFSPEILQKNSSLINISEDIYAIVQNNKISIFDKTNSAKQLELTNNASYLIHSICKLADEKFLSATSKGLFLLEKNKAPECFLPELQNKEVNSLLIDKEKTIWIGTTSGLYIIKNNNPLQTILLLNNPEDTYSVSSNSIQSIYEDADGLIWIGTSEGGVNIYDADKKVFLVFNHYSEIPLSANSISGIFQNKNELWIGTAKGLNHLILENEAVSELYSGKNKIIKSDIFYNGKGYPNSISSNTISSIIKDKDDNIWFGSHDNGISVYNPILKNWKYFNTNNSPLKTNIIYHLMCATDGKIWISTQVGFYSYDPSSGIFKSFLQNENGVLIFPSGYIISIYEDKQHIIWVASTNGIFKLKNNGELITIFNNQFNNPSSLSYNIATSFLEDSKGRFWVTTLGGGINLMNRKNGTFQSYTKKDGLANDITYCIIEDKKENLWISTNSGLSCFNPETINIVNYTKKDGLVSNEFSQNAFFKNNQGELFFGSPEGLVVFSPEKIVQRKNDLQIVITSLKINYEERILNSDNIVELFHNDKSLILEFSVPDFRYQEKIQYAFQLEGFDNRWHNISSLNRLASYTNLPFGNYYFRVKVRTGNMPWQSKQLELKIKVIPPFWLSSWFISFEIIMSLAVIILLVKYFSQRKLRKKIQLIELQSKLQTERERISRDLHDNVGSNLTYIITSLDNISYQLQNKSDDPPKSKIESLGEFARSTMQQLRETIWAINKESITVSELKEKINEHFSKILLLNENRSFCVSINGSQNSLLNSSQAVHLFRIVQEAVNNAVKYSEATTISVEISETENHILTLVISDNGMGMSQQDTFESHYGLENMKGRVKEMKGEFILHTEINKGTSVKILVPV